MPQLDRKEKQETKMDWKSKGMAFLLVLLLSLAAVGCEKEKARDAPSKTAATDQAHTYVTTADVKVRGGPGNRYEAVAEIPRETKVQVVDREGGWLKIVSKHGNPPGYIDERFARPLSSEIKGGSSVQGSYTILADTHVRQGPGLHYPVITKIPKGMKVYIVGAERDWLMVQSKHGRAPGYIEKTYAQKR